MIRRLTSSPKPSCAGLLVHREQVAVASARVAVAHAVVAGEVGARLGRGDHVVGRRCRAARAAARSPRTLPPSSSIRSSVSLGHLRHAGLDALARRAPAARRSAGRRGARRSAARPPRGCSSEVESQGSLPDHVPEQQRGVGDVARERPALVERGGERDHPVARDRAVGGLEARRCRTARPAGGSSRRCRCRSPTARVPAATAAAEPPRRAAGHALAVPRVLHRAEARVLVRRAHRELVHVRLAEHRRARGAQLAHAVAVYGGR